MRVITLNTKNIVVGIKNVGKDYMLQENELETQLGELGQIMQNNGSFADDDTLIEPISPEPTNKEINDNLMVVMSGIVDIYMTQIGMWEG